MLPIASLAYRVPGASLAASASGQSSSTKLLRPTLGIQDGGSDGVRELCPHRAIWGMNGTALRELSPLPAEAVRCPDKVATTGIASALG